ELSGVDSGFGKGERDEVQEFLKKRLDGFHSPVPFELRRQLLPNRVGAFERSPTAVAEHADLYRFDVRGRGGGTRNGLRHTRPDQPLEVGLGSRPALATEPVV